MAFVNGDHQPDDVRRRGPERLTGRGGGQEAM
jgi:hypothetical protein